jgi:uncharacterized protein YukE
MSDWRNRILLDQEEFQRAANGFAELSSDLDNIRARIDSMLTRLMQGFDTEAGYKFKKSAENLLLEPMDQQRAVLDHVSEMLGTAREKYESVFNAYQELNDSIRFN